MKTDSFNALWQAYQSRLLMFIQSRVNDRLVAEDLLQDVFLKAFLHLEKVQQPEKTESWLFQIARHRVIDHYRAQKIVLPLSDFDKKLVATNTSDLPVDSFYEAIELPRKDQLSNCIVNTVATLAPPYQQALQVTGADGKTQQQLANTANISLSAAKSRVQRGRKLLKQKLQQCCHFELNGSQQVEDFWQKPSVDDAQSCCTTC